MNENSTGVGFLGLLTILFIGLKLSNQINWSWWAVLAPAWLPACITVVSLGIFLVADWAMTRDFH